MSAAVKTALLDTNVWVDRYSSVRPGHAAATALFDVALRKGYQLLYPVTSSKDVFYLIASDYKAWVRSRCGGTLTHAAAAAAVEIAWGCVDNMCEIATAVGCDQSDVWLARRRKRLHRDFEDNLVLSAADRARADLLVTNDDQLLRHAPVAAMGVADAIAYLESLD